MNKTKNNFSFLIGSKKIEIKNELNESCVPNPSSKSK